MVQHHREAPRLAYLLSQYPKLSEAFIIREIRGLRALGFHIDVASVNAPDRGADGLTAEEVEERERTYYVKRHGLRGALPAHLRTLLGRPGAYLRGWRAVLRHGGLDLRALFYHLMYFTEALMVGVWLAERGQRHVHAHFGMQASTVGLYVKRVFGTGLSITVHGPDVFYAVERYLLADKVREADFIATISHYARSQLMRVSPHRHWHKLVVSRLGVDPQRFAPRPFRAAPEVFEVICVGRLTPAKGQHVLVEAVHRLVGEGRRLRLRLVGDGEDRASLERQVAELGLTEQVVFEGAVNQDRIRDLYAAADAFAIPSFAEGIPVVLMEAMAMEIPCVTTWITGVPELIRNGVDGLLVAPGDGDALAAALARLMDDPGLRQRLGQSGRQRVLAEYDLGRNVARLGEIFRARLASGENGS